MIGVQNIDWTNGARRRTLFSQRRRDLGSSGIHVGLALPGK
jgi:hypothetical protein